MGSTRPPSAAQRDWRELGLAFDPAREILVRLEARPLLERLDSCLAGMSGEGDSAVARA